jgi:PBP1b-binding outer membrane lipoprotein LpoB
MLYYHDIDIVERKNYMKITIYPLLLILILLAFLLCNCSADEPDTTSKVCDKHGCVTCKTYSNYDGTKFETKCAGTGEYSAMYNGDDGVIVERDDDNE